MESGSPFWRAPLESSPPVVYPGTEPPPVPAAAPLGVAPAAPAPTPTPAAAAPLTWSDWINWWKSGQQALQPWPMAQGGVTGIVGEKGWEYVNLPPGSIVAPPTNPFETPTATGARQAFGTELTQAGYQPTGPPPAPAAAMPTMPTGPAPTAASPATTPPGPATPTTPTTPTAGVPGESTGLPPMDEISDYLSPDMAADIARQLEILKAYEDSPQYMFEKLQAMFPGVNSALFIQLLDTWYGVADMEFGPPAGNSQGIAGQITQLEYLLTRTVSPDRQAALQQQLGVLRDAYDAARRAEDEARRAAELAKERRLDQEEYERRRAEEAAAAAGGGSTAGRYTPSLAPYTLPRNRTASWALPIARGATGLVVPPLPAFANGVDIPQSFNTLQEAYEYRQQNNLRTMGWNELAMWAGLQAPAPAPVASSVAQPPTTAPRPVASSANQPTTSLRPPVYDTKSGTYRTPNPGPGQHSGGSAYWTSTGPAYGNEPIPYPPVETTTAPVVTKTPTATSVVDSGYSEATKPSGYTPPPYEPLGVPIDVQMQDVDTSRSDGIKAQIAFLKKMLGVTLSPHRQRALQAQIDQLELDLSDAMKNEDFARSKAWTEEGRRYSRELYEAQAARDAEEQKKYNESVARATGESYEDLSNLPASEGGPVVEYPEGPGFGARADESSFYVNGWEGLAPNERMIVDYQAMTAKIVDQATGKVLYEWNYETGSGTWKEGIPPVTADNVNSMYDAAQVVYTTPYSSKVTTPTTPTIPPTTTTSGVDKLYFDIATGEARFVAADGRSYVYIPKNPGASTFDPVNDPEWLQRAGNNVTHYDSTKQKLF